MLALLLSVLATCIGALFLGQAALRLAGAKEWSWLSPAVGLSVAMLLASPSYDLPGRSSTMAIVLAVLTLAAAIWCLRSPPHRPPLAGLLAAAPVALLVAVPFLAAGREGILGVTVDNDMAVHLRIVESVSSSAVAAVSPLPQDYPLGPHTVVAALAEGLGVHADAAFSGWSLAVPVINAWTVQAVVRRSSWYGRVIASTVVGLPFLVAAFYGEGSFKEVAQAGLVLAVALGLAGCGPRLGRGRWVPLALLLGGIISVFSLPGLPWPLAIGALWLVGLLVIAARRGKLREVPATLRGELPALGIGLAVLLLVLLPQVDRIRQFVELRNGTGIKVSDIGNLVGPLSGWQAFGVWRGADFRVSGGHPFDLWTAFVVVLVLFGAYWAFRRGRWLLPLAAAAAMVIWKVSAASQSPYVAAKALVVASPLVLLLAALPLVDREPGPAPVGRRRWLRLLVPALGLVLLFRIGSDDLRGLRGSAVGPTNHARQLESFRPLIAGQRTLVFGSDEFLTWELAGAFVQQTGQAEFPLLSFRPGKHWEYGHAIDFDSLPATTLNEYSWIVTTRDAASSAPPRQLRLVRSTADFQLWQRVGEIPEHSILEEGEWPGTVLDCTTPEGRSILAKGGVAAVRHPPRVAAVRSPHAGETVSVPIDPPPGTWELEAPYLSSYPVEVTGPGLHTELPANFERSAVRFPIGRIVVRERRPATIRLHVGDNPLAPPSAGAAFQQLVLTPVGIPERIVPIARACGKYVDWYRSG